MKWNHRLIDALLCIVLVALIALSCTGCVRRETIIVEPGAPVRTAEPIQARLAIYQPGGSYVVQEGQIPAGWWVVPPDVTDEPISGSPE